MIPTSAQAKEGWVVGEERQSQRFIQSAPSCSERGGRYIRDCDSVEEMERKTHVSADAVH